MTSNHINMFAKAKRMQEGWKPGVGDRVWLRYWETDLVVIRKRTELINGKQKISLNDFRKYPLEDLDFLPSIEQMAEMWHEEFKNKKQSGLDFFDALISFIDDSKIPDEWSEDIIVLAYIMYFFYGLTWSEEKGEWV